MITNTMILMRKGNNCHTMINTKKKEFSKVLRKQTNSTFNNLNLYKGYKEGKE